MCVIGSLYLGKYLHGLGSTFLLGQAKKTWNCVHHQSQRRSQDIQTACTMGSLYLGSYLTPSNGYIGFPYHPLVRPKRHGTACVICPKGEARTHGPRAPSVPKAKLGHSNRVRHRVILPLVMAILGFLTIPWLGPKDTEPCVPSVPKAKLGYSNRVCHQSQRRSQDI